MASQSRLDQIRDLVNQWETQIGFRASVADWMVDEMADSLDYGGLGHAISSLYDVGQYMRYHIGGPSGTDVMGQDVANSMPWAFWGMSSMEYDKKLEAFDTAFRTLTGQTAPQDLIQQALHEHQGTMTGTEFETWLMTQDSIKNQYGWLKYGLDFNQFQTRKLAMRSSFGRELSNEEAVAQLQYHHAAQGPNVGVTAQQTLGQQERKQVQVGISGSVVR